MNDRGARTDAVRCDGERSEPGRRAGIGDHHAVGGIGHRHPAVHGDVRVPTELHPIGELGDHHPNTPAGEAGDLGREISVGVDPVGRSAGVDPEAERLADVALHVEAPTEARHDAVLVAGPSDRRRSGVRARERVVHEAERAVGLRGHNRPQDDGARCRLGARSRDCRRRRRRVPGRSAVTTRCEQRNRQHADQHPGRHPRMMPGFGTGRTSVEVRSSPSTTDQASTELWDELSWFSTPTAACSSTRSKCRSRPPPSCTYAMRSARPSAITLSLCCTA